MRMNPHLNFNGECEAAFRFYEQCLRGKITMMLTFAESPIAEQVPPAWRGKILHATIEFGAQVLTGADAGPGSYEKPQGFGVLLHLDDAAEADRIFSALAENGAVQMPIQETFWALRFGMVTDRFGTPWMINCGKVDS